MTSLEKIKQWLATYPGYDILGKLHVGYTDQLPCGSGLFPAGLVEVGRREDIFGNITVSNQLNFALYAVLEKPPGDDVGATLNADWVMDFQRWVQEQSIRKKAPCFGNIDMEQEVITAQNGTIYEASSEGYGVYLVQLCTTYKLFYEE